MVRSGSVSARAGERCSVERRARPSEGRSQRELSGFARRADAASWETQVCYDSERLPWSVSGLVSGAPQTAKRDHQRGSVSEGINGFARLADAVSRATTA